MTVYVDNARIPARVGGHRARWSHLTADSKNELHDLAGRLGLRRAWFQAHCRHHTEDECWHWHYDLTDSMRKKAIRLGAKPVDIRELGRILVARRPPTTEEAP